ncbi:hypothetical protein [Reyranella sp.]|uniref:hypothetical protein n=1 Tax=Reyranella sp. TaxID=1929291 RepID=UPI003D0C30C8
MSFVSFPRLVALFAAAASLACAGGSGHAADSNRVLTGAVLPSPEAMAGTPSGAERVGKLLAERSTSSDPDVPLPQRNLTVPEPAFVPLTGPRIYGRGEEGSVVLGLKIPIPADHRVSQKNTRYSGADGGAAAGSAR